MNYKEDLNNRFIAACNRILETNLVENKSRLADSIGIANNKLSEILSNRMKAGVSEIQKLCNFYDVSFSYLFNNEGDIFFKENASPFLAQNQQAQNMDLQAHFASPIEESGINLDSEVKRIELSQFKEVRAGGIPLIPLDAAAGFLSGSSTQIMEYECEQYVIPGFNNATFLIRISGDSMTPKYESGDIVACQRLTLDTFFQWNKVYVIDSEQGVLIKRVKQGSIESNLTLVSDNEQYQPFELKKSEIYGIGRVVGLIRYE